MQVWEDVASSNRSQRSRGAKVRAMLARRFCNKGDAWRCNISEVLCQSYSIIIPGKDDKDAEGDLQ
jgi:hypothetical protein